MIARDMDFVSTVPALPVTSPSMDKQPMAGELPPFKNWVVEACNNILLKLRETNPKAGVREVAAEIDASEPSLYRWRREGFVPKGPAADALATKSGVPIKRLLKS
jgi:hypothetical protein